MSTLSHSQSNSDLIRLCPYMNRFANSSFSNSNRTFSSVSGLSNASLYNRTRSMIIKPLLSNAATMSFSSRFDNDSMTDNGHTHTHTHNPSTSITLNTNTSTNEMPHHEIGSSFKNHNNDDNTDNNDDSQSHDQDSSDYHNQHDSTSAADVTMSTIFKPEPHAVTLTQSIAQAPTQSNQYTMSTSSQQTSFFNLSQPSGGRVVADTINSGKPLSRRLSQHLHYPLVQPGVQMRQQQQQLLQQEQQAKKMSNPVIALIAHDLLKFIEEENHYRVARENLKSDVLKIRQSRTRQSSAVRSNNATSERDNRSSSKVNANNYYYTNNSSSNANVAPASKPRARSSVSAFRNVVSSVKPQYSHNHNHNHSNNNNHNHNHNQANTFISNSNSIFSGKPVVNTYHKPASAKPAPPAAHTIKNANELIDKLIYEVYAGK